MSSFGTTILIFFLLLLISQGEANNNVINNICEKSMDPAFCLKNTVQIDPRSVEADLPSITLGIVALTAVKTRVTKTLLTDALAKQPPIDPSLKPKYEQCVNTYTQSIENIDKARPNIQSRNYKAFADVANNALKGAESCEDSLMGSPVDPEIGASNQELLKLCNMMFTCADQLLA